MSEPKKAYAAELKRRMVALVRAGALPPPSVMHDRACASSLPPVRDRCTRECAR